MASDISSEIQRVIKRQQAHRFNVHRTPAEVRIKKLKKLENYILQHREQIQKALYLDFKKPASETDLSEIYASLVEVRHAQKHLNDWMFPEHVSAPLSIMATKSYIQYEPKGVVLIISPWNFPFVLAVGPLISAIAAGNCIIVKPAELAPHTSEFLGQMIDDLFTKDEVALFQGGEEVARILLKQRFDHIFFTGSPRVGRIVMKAAAEHLTSVTLELGGKSPAIVDRSTDLEDAADKITWGKFINAGQTCIAPDYLLVAQTIKEKFLDLLRKKITDTYRSEIEERVQSEHYASINQPHFEHLKRLLEHSIDAGAEVVIGGTWDEKSSFMAPTVLQHVDETMPVMNEEIFGPVLPVLSYSTIEEAVDMVNRRPNPLALYIFSRSNNTTDYFLKNTSAGSSCINETLLQFMHSGLPFGGAGDSGIGKSHGIYGFRAFSNARSVLKSPVRFNPSRLFYPPYTPGVKKMIDWLIKYF